MSSCNDKEPLILPWKCHAEIIQLAAGERGRASFSHLYSEFDSHQLIMCSCLLSHGSRLQFNTWDAGLSFTSHTHCYCIWEALRRLCEMFVSKGVFLLTFLVLFSSKSIRTFNNRCSFSSLRWQFAFFSQCFSLNSLIHELIRKNKNS